MRRIACALAAAGASAAAAAAAPTALLLENGRIHTGVAGQPRAEAVLAIGERIAYVGDSAGAHKLAPDGTRVVDLGGGAVFPGLTDSHAHLSGIGWRELNFDLTGVESVEALKRRLAERAAADPADWIVGVGWIESKWKPAVFPKRQDLDEAVSDRPVVLERADGHAISRQYEGARDRGH